MWTTRNLSESFAIQVSKGKYSEFSRVTRSNSECLMSCAQMWWLSHARCAAPSFDPNEDHGVHMLPATHVRKGILPGGAPSAANDSMHWLPGCFKHPSEVQPGPKEAAPCAAKKTSILLCFRAASTFHLVSFLASSRGGRPTGRIECNPSRKAGGTRELTSVKTCSLSRLTKMDWQVLLLSQERYDLVQGSGKVKSTPVKRVCLHATPIIL